MVRAGGVFYIEQSAKRLRIKSRKTYFSKEKLI